MPRRLLTACLTLVFLQFLALPALAQDLRLPSIISDHMVLQRHQPVAVWGWAEPGSEVAVSFKGQTHTATADDAGRWRVDLESMNADADPAQMTITSGDQTLTLNDILVGEVWLCSGQSNMEWSVQRSDNAEQEIAAANWPQIRHIKAPHRPSMTPMDDIDAQWQVCSPDTAAAFTAVGYYFGRQLHRELNVPIGLINCSWGGTLIEPWIPLSGFAAVPELKDQYGEIAAKQPDSPAYKALASAYMEELNRWLDASKKQVTEQEPLAEPPAFPDQLKPYTSHQSPTVLFNGMLQPFIPYTLRGSIWYQGESNRARGMQYLDYTRAQLLGWRAYWERPDLPYYYVQIAPYQYGDDHPHELPRFWEAQAQIEKQIPHTGMVVIHDIGNLNDIHPGNKQGVGKRLANMALKRTYGRSEIIDSGPRFESMRVEGDKLLLNFSHAADGLASRDGEALNWFEIAGEAEPWTEATAEIVAPDTIAVSAEGISTPVAVRFAWHKLAEPNLVNSADLPAAPFRAGEPPKIDFLSLNVPDSHDYELIYEADLNQLGHSVEYIINNAPAFAGSFDRVAYFIQMSNEEETEGQWVYVSMDAFTDDLTKIGIPTLDSGILFQQPVHNMVVNSNVWRVPNRGGLTGNIEFWPNNYGKSNAAGVPDALGSAYDNGDQINTNTPDGYGCMQVHTTKPTVTIFALNNWKNSPFDLGIGTNNEGGELDWTFTKSSDRYKFKRMKVLVRPSKP